MTPIIRYSAWIPCTWNKIARKRRLFEIGAITLWPFILSAKEKMSEKTLRHESIHIKQQAETLVLGFYLIYLWDYLTLRIRYKMKPEVEHEKAYVGIRFEQEAYNNESDETYLLCRKPYSWIKYKVGKTNEIDNA